MTHLAELRLLVGIDAQDELVIGRDRARLQLALEEAEGQFESWLRGVYNFPVDAPPVLPGYLLGFASGRVDEDFYHQQYSQAVCWLKQGLDAGFAAAALSRLRTIFVETTSSWSAGQTVRALRRVVDLAHSIQAVVFHLGHILEQLERTAAHDIARVRRSCEALLGPASERLVNAYVQHLDWKIRAYRLALDDAADMDSLPLSGQNCDLGHWLQDGGLELVPAARRDGLVAAHERLHQLVRMALAESRGGRPQEVLKYLRDIEAASDEMVSTLGDCISLRLSEIGVQDSLTRLGTRRLFDNDIVKHVHKLQLDGSPLALLLIDVDHFKQINDRHGRAIGDEVLQSIASGLASCLRASDRLYRWGSEELAVLVPTARSEDVRMVAERIRGDIADRRIATAVGDLRITVSIGGTLIAGNADLDPHELFVHCDNNLRRAKDAGRNRVVISDYSAA